MERQEAIIHAAKAHGEQRDKCGEFYIEHPIAVAIAVDSPKSPANTSRRLLKDTIVVAYLHDVLEDTDYHLDAQWFTPPQWEALHAITRQPDETYFEYIEAVCQDKIAMIVKLADLWHNLRPERMGCLQSNEQLSLEKRYYKAREMIWESLGVHWWPNPPTYRC